MAQNDPQHVWLVSRPLTLLCHLCDCMLRPEPVQSQAEQERKSYSPKKGMCHSNMLVPPAVMTQTSTLLAPLPYQGPHNPSLHQPLPMWPSLPTFSIPVTTTSTSSNLTNVSPYGSPSLPPSPVLSDISSHHSKWRRITQSGRYSTASGSFGPPTLSVSPSPSPTHWAVEVVWTSADQADWEIGFARLTASAGLPLQWVENLEWKKLCDRFLPKAKIPSSKVLTHTIIPGVLEGLKSSAREDC